MNKTLFYFFLLFAFSFANLKTAKAQKLDNEAVFKEYNRIAGYKKLKRKNSEVFQGNKKKQLF